MIIKRLQILINHAEVNFAVILSFFFSFIPQTILRDALTLYLRIPLKPSHITYEIGNTVLEVLRTK